MNILTENVEMDSFYSFINITICMFVNLGACWSNAGEKESPYSR